MRLLILPQDRPSQPEEGRMARPVLHHERAIGRVIPSDIGRIVLRGGYPASFAETGALKGSHPLPSTPVLDPGAWSGARCRARFLPHCRPAALHRNGQRDGQRNKHACWTDV